VLSKEEKMIVNAEKPSRKGKGSLFAILIVETAPRNRRRNFEL